MDSLSSPISGNILLADYAATDSAGKLNVIGGGISTIPVQNTGVTSPFSVVARLSSPIPFEDQVSVEVLLADASGAQVVGPGSTPGQPTPIRIAQKLRLEKPRPAGTAVPAGSLDASAQLVVNFTTGLPLTPGQVYTWRVQVDGAVIASASFLVPAAPTGPVYG